VSIFENFSDLECAKWKMNYLNFSEGVVFADSLEIQGLKLKKLGIALQLCHPYWHQFQLDHTVREFGLFCHHKQFQDSV